MNAFIGRLICSPDSAMLNAAPSFAVVVIRAYRKKIYVSGVGINVQLVKRRRESVKPMKGQPMSAAKFMDYKPTCLSFLMDLCSAQRHKTFKCQFVFLALDIGEC